MEYILLIYLISFIWSLGSAISLSNHLEVLTPFEFILVCATPIVNTIIVLIIFFFPSFIEEMKEEGSKL